MIDPSSLPTDREGRARWAAEREDYIAAKVTAAMERIVVGAYERFVGTLTASGDLSALDSIPDAWLTFLHEDLVDDLGETYYAGQMTAWLGMPYEPPAGFAKHWSSVANQNAVSYVGDATNRLVGVGDQTWHHVRTQVQNGVRDGMTNEALAAKVQDVAAFSSARAATIARTETNGAYVQGDMAGNRALGDQGPIEKVWVSTTDARTRPSHVEAHDQVRPMAEPFTVGGIAMDAPHDPDAPAGEVVNCRCYVEFLYAGDARPDGSTVELPEGATPPAPAVWAPPEFTGTLTPLANQPQLGGAHRKMVLQGDDGKQYLFKPQEGWVAHGEAAVSEIGLRAGLNVPRVYVHTYAGEVGSLQELLPNARAGFPGPASGFNPAMVSKADIHALQDHRALDWLVGNHDSHAGQFIRTGYAKDGAQVIGIDKGQAFKYFGKDQLSYTYHPNGVFGEARPVHNLIEEAYARNELPDGVFNVYTRTKSKQGSWGVVNDLMAIPDDEYRAMLRTYADGAFKGNQAAIDQFLDAAVARKNDLSGDLMRYNERLYAERLKVRKASAPKPVSLDGAAGGPRGMAGALPAQADTQWMAKHDSPLTDVRKATAARDYTSGSSWANNPLRAGQTPTPKIVQLSKELGTIKSDMIVHRGTSLTSVLPPGGPASVQGQVIVDDAFLSTSAGGKAAFSGDTMLTIRINAGTTASYVQPISVFPNERELLLDRGAHLYVHKVQQVGGTWHWDVEVVTPEWAQATGTKVWHTNTRSYR